jgi:hypothetical protein
MEMIRLVSDEQRARGKRHECAQFRADERHRFGEAHAPPHRLGDFVQRVALLVGGGNFRKCVGAHQRRRHDVVLTVGAGARGTGFPGRIVVRGRCEKRKQLAELRDNRRVERLARLLTHELEGRVR